MTAALALTYLGMILCYAASPKAHGTRGITRFSASIPDTGIRGAGVVGLGLGLGGFLWAWPPAEGVLLWLSAVMLAASAVVVFAPLAPRFLPVSGGLALAALALSLLL